MRETRDTIGTQIDALIAATDERFNRVDKRFADIDTRFDGIDKRLDDVDRRFDEIPAQFAELRAYIEFGYERLHEKMNGRFDVLEGKLDRVLAVLPTPRRRKRP